MNTVLENVLVREYLRGLSQECISLPVAQARELREQIDQVGPPASAPAGLVTQSTIPVRSGQRQGLELDVENESDWTQTILGVDRQAIARGFQDIQVTVITGPHLNSSGNVLSGRSYFASPGIIPPHSDRAIRVTWISHMCLMENGIVALSDLPLRVRVGLVTRTENVALDTDYALAGPSHGRCG